MRSSLLATLLLLAACGPGVHDLTVSSAPILTVRGNVDLANLKRTDPAAPLVAALIWAGKVHVSPICIKNAGKPELKDACHDPYSVFLGDTESESALDPSGDGTFELTLARLPHAKVSVGDSQNRIAYGTLILVEDLNGDGHAGIVDQFGPPEPGSDGMPPRSDRVIAASFFNLNAPQQRLVFREGAFDPGSFFYPAPECPEPPAGFSVLRTQGMGIADGCSVTGADEPIALQSIVGVDDTLACRVSYLGPGSMATVAEASPDMGLPPDAVCVDAETILLVHPSPGLCTNPVFYALKGCWEDPYCAEPQWDHTANKPEWWPC